MIPNITRGDRFGGLMSYLAGPGRTNEHDNPHVIAGEADLYAFYGGRELTHEDALAMARDLDESRRLMGTEVSIVKTRADPGTGVLLKERQPAHVWHASLSLAAHEGQLSDEQWNAIATDFVDAMGFTAESGKAECRWVAVRHGLSKNGNDHVHIAVSLVRMDGTKASTHNDFRKAQTACRDLEVKYGLAITGDRAHELGTRGVTPAAARIAAERGAPETTPARLARTVRAAAAQSADEAEFVRRCRRSGLLIRPRFAKGRRDVVEGYSVAIRPEGNAQTIWHGGGKLARDLTLTRLRQDWPDTLDGAMSATAEWTAAYRGERPAAVGREADEPNPDLWARYTDDVRAMRERLAAIPVDDQSAWAAAAKETAGVFASWSIQTEAEPGPLAAVSAELARTAQIRAHQVQPRPGQMPSLGGAALIVGAASVKGSSAAAHLLLLRELARSAGIIHQMILARGDLRRAEQMESLVRSQLQEVRASLGSVTVAEATRSVDPALAELRRFDTPGATRTDASGPGEHEPGAERRALERDDAPSLDDDLDR